MIAERGTGAGAPDGAGQDAAGVKVQPVPQPGLGTLPSLYTEEAVASYLGIDCRTLARMRTRKEIPWRKIAGRIRYSQEDVQVILDRALQHAEPSKVPEKRRSQGTRAVALTRKTPAKLSGSSGYAAARTLRMSAKPEGAVDCLAADRERTQRDTGGGA